MPTEIARSTATGPVSITTVLTAAGAADDPVARFQQLVDQAMLAAAEEVLLPALRMTLSIEGPPPSEMYTPPRRTTDEAHEATYQAHGWRHLWDSLFVREGDDGGIEIGSPNTYGLFLELGTREMAPRPWFVPTVTRTDVQQDFAAALARHFTRLSNLTAAGAPPGAGGDRPPG